MGEEDGNEDEIIDKVTKKKVPRKKPVRKDPSMRKEAGSPVQDEETSRKKVLNMPPKRIKREDTKELFPSLAIESIEQKKLYKIAESIGGMAN